MNNIWSSDEFFNAPEFAEYAMWKGKKYPVVPYGIDQAKQAEGQYITADLMLMVKVTDMSGIKEGEVVDFRSKKWTVTNVNLDSANECNILDLVRYGS